MAMHLENDATSLLIMSGIVGFELHMKAAETISTEDAPILLSTNMIQVVMCTSGTRFIKLFAIQDLKDDFQEAGFLPTGWGRRLVLSGATRLYWSRDCMLFGEI